jgi:hypothetical protein
MDDSFVANINLSFATVLSIEYNGNGNSSRTSFNENTISKVTRIDKD